MDDFIGFIIIVLLAAILIKLNQGNKKPSAKEIKKIKDMWKVIWWVIGISILFLVLFFVWLFWKY